jgi:hypothetical protein
MSSLLLLLACRGPDETSAPLHLDPVEGNPLVPRAPLYPWPSDLWLVDDPTTPSGHRVEVPQELLPEGVLADSIADDGFTRAPAILAWFEGGIDPLSLPDIGGSVEEGSPVLVLEAGTAAPVPAIAEVDANVLDANVQALIVRPVAALAPSTTYVVVLRDGLRTPDGGPPPVEDAFRALRDGIPTDDPTVEAMRPAFEVVLDTISAAGLATDEVVLAWQFTTRSEEAVVAPVLAMHDLAMDWTLPAYAPISDTNDGANRLVVGTFVAPDFLGPEGRIALDADGQPIVKGDRTVEFLVTIPNTVAAPRPVVAFGHGFFSAKEETTWGSLQQLIQPLAVSTLSVDFIGFNEADAFETLGALTGDLVALAEVADQQLQSHVHFTLLARLLEEQLADGVVEDRGAGPFHPLDATRLEYMGISNGGTQGSVILATSPMYRSATLVVPGGAWTHMLQRAVQWTSMGSLIELQYTDPLELQLVLSMTQQVLDPVDIVNYARGLVTEPFPGRPAHRVAMHMAVGDSQVANVVTEWVARSAGVPLVTPSAREVWGLETVALPPPGRPDLASALFVYDELYPPEVEDNVPPALDNGAHETIRDLAVYLAQVSAFIEDGALVQVCDGACDPE